MDEVQAQNDRGMINLWQSAMIPKTGVFEWNDSLKTVVFKKFESDVKADKFKSKFQDRIAHVKRERNDQEYLKRISKLVSDMRTKAANERSTGGDPSMRPIAYLDCKAVALNEMLVTRQPIPDTFLEFFLQSVAHAHCAHCQLMGLTPQFGHRNDIDSGPPFDQLMAALSVYFEYFFAKKDADEHSDGLHVSRSQAEEQMLIEITLKMKEASKHFGIVYNTMILGLGMDHLHHMNRGKCRVSTTLTDRQMFEALYTYAVEFIWIVFGRRDREVVKREVGRLLRSDSFNRATRPSQSPAKQTEEPIENLDLDPRKIVMTKAGKPLKDSQILALIDRMSNNFLSHGLSGQETEKLSPRAKKEASAHGSMGAKSARSNSTRHRARSAEIDGKDPDGVPLEGVSNPLALKKTRNQVELAAPLTDEQILACIDRVATKYEKAFKTAATEHFISRAANKRPPKKSLMEQRSVAAECVIPSVKPPGGDRHAQKVEEVNPFVKAPTKEEPITFNRFINVKKLMLGIIGQPLINYNASSLIPLVNVSSQQGQNNAAGGTTVATAPTTGTIVTAPQSISEQLRTLRQQGKNNNQQDAANAQQTPITRETTAAMDDEELLFLP